MERCYNDACSALFRLASDPRLRLGASSRRCAAVFARLHCFVNDCVQCVKGAHLGFLGCASVPRFTTTALGSASVSSSARAPLRAYVAVMVAMAVTA
jgi:hypothetical protein